MIDDNFLTGITRPGTHRRPCPECGKGSRDTALSVTVKPDGSAVWICHRCGFKGAKKDDRGPVLIHRGTPKAAPAEHVKLSAFGRDLWRSCRPLAGTVAQAYLEARGCRLPPVDGDLRFHPALRHPHGYTGPAMIALITDAITCEPISLHRTWICSDGTKPKEATPPRLLLKGHRKAGGVIRLWPDDAVTLGLTIAEGIETALAAAWAASPVWALIDAGNMAEFPVLNGLEGLTIVADNDPAGLKGARACADRWQAAGIDVLTVLPPPGRDMADVAAGAIR